MMPINKSGILQNETDEIANITKQPNIVPVLLVPNSSLDTTEDVTNKKTQHQTTNLDLNLIEDLASLQQDYETTNELDTPKTQILGNGGQSLASPVTIQGSATCTITSLPQTLLNKRAEATVIQHAQAVQNVQKRPSDTIVSGQVIPAKISKPSDHSGYQTLTTSSMSAPGSSAIAFNQAQMLQKTMASLTRGLTVIPQLSNQGPLTPTKTLTISSQGVVTAAGKQLFASHPSSPIKVLNKLPMSPNKKITMIPVSFAKSPQKSFMTMSTGTTPSSSVVTVFTRNVVTNTAASSANTNSVTLSPTKVLIRQPVQLQQGLSNTKTMVVGNAPHLPPGGLTGNMKQYAIPISSAPGVQQISVPGSKFQYVRLVTPTTNTPISTIARAAGVPSHLQQQVKPIAPAQMGQPPNIPPSAHVRFTMPVQGTQHLVVAPKPMSAPNTSQAQRILLPAPNQVAIRPAVSVAGAPHLPGVMPSQLPPGTIISSAPNLSGVQGFALVPAQYVTQLQHQPSQQHHSSQGTTSQQPVLPQHMSNLMASQGIRPDFVAIASSDPAVSLNTITRNVINGSAIEAAGARPRKPCNCTKSQCLKLYCDCFANGEFCHNCNCNNCANNLEHEEERSRAIKSCLDRNPAAFHPKIGKGNTGIGDRRHNKGCNCKRSGCLKNYCECYEAKIMCSNTCKCIGCKNYEESPERKTLMHLADAAEVRVLQQTAAKSKLSSQISDVPTRPAVNAAGERLPYSFVTTEVAEATCACLLAQAEEAERLKMPDVIQERMVIEEFGRCLMQIIESANKTKAPSPPP